MSHNKNEQHLKIRVEEIREDITGGGYLDSDELKKIEYLALRVLLDTKSDEDIIQNLLGVYNLDQYQQIRRLYEACGDQDSAATIWIELYNTHGAIFILADLIDATERIGL